MLLWRKGLARTAIFISSLVSPQDSHIAINRHKNGDVSSFTYSSLTQQLCHMSWLAHIGCGFVVIIDIHDSETESVAHPRTPIKGPFVLLLFACLPQGQCCLHSSEWMHPETIAIERSLQCKSIAFIYFCVPVLQVTVAQPPLKNSDKGLFIHMTTIQSYVAKPKTR